MKYRALPAVKERSEYFEGIESYIAASFRRLIYLPLIRELGAPSGLLKNSREDLVDAIASGQIQYVHGHFEGRFDASLSKELRRLGADWDRKHGWWRVPESKLPYDIRSAIGASYSRFQAMAQKFDKRLQSMVPEEIAGSMKLEKLFDTTLFRVNRDVEASMKAITVGAQLTEDGRRRIASEYSKNMQLYIQDWTQTEIEALRKQVQSRAFQGLRYESMVASIQKSYGESQNKARFLARQETNLLMTKFKQVRYQDNGVDDYRWKCVAGSALHPVRPLHKLLDNRVFRWDNPPIVNANGERKNPGQDYGCRCFAIGLVRF